ncbi:MAG: cytochrome c nitrite reductase small subunit [Anaerolineae bacterium]|nr:MAG: cytochrome c nitrite reductase small subunit [Anaerolineae bacterium]
MTVPSSPAPLSWRILILMAGLGILFGLGAFTFTYAEGTSYISNNPETCVNCHIMRPQFSAWVKGSHHNVATCNDCHTPHDFFGKWFVKGVNGFNHSRAFTSGDFPEPIQITDFNRNVALNNCRDCHASLVSQVVLGGQHEELDCLACHNGVGHDD